MYFSFRVLTCNQSFFNSFGEKFKYYIGSSNLAKKLLATHSWHWLLFVYSIAYNTIVAAKIGIKPCSLLENVFHLCMYFKH